MVAAWKAVPSRNIIKKRLGKSLSSSDRMDKDKEGKCIYTNLYDLTNTSF